MIYSLILNTVLLIIIITILVNNARRKEIKYRILITKIDQSFWYRPQVRIKGIWYNLIYQEGEFEPNGRVCSEYLDPQDALEDIKQLKLRGDTLTIISDQNLLSNQTIEYVE